jgi:hypothetical protein
MDASPATEPLPLRDEEIEVGGHHFAAMAGSDEAGRPAEIFLSGAKTGSALDAILGDAAVVISIGLQHGISAAVLGRSIARMPEAIDGPATAPVSPIGAALNLIAEYLGRWRNLAGVNPLLSLSAASIAIPRCVYTPIPSEGCIISAEGHD